MRKHRRYLFALLFALALAVVAAGCGGGGGSTSTGAAGGTTGAANVSGSISIMGIWVGKEQKQFQKVIDAFNQQYPNVTVKYDPVGDNLPTVLSTAVEGGNPPDIAAPAQPGLIQGFVDSGAVQPIDFMQSDVQDNLGDSGVTLGTFGGKLYGVLYKANNKSTVWYNSKAFSDAGVQPATDWDTFLQNAQTIKASGLPAYSIGGADGWTLTDLFENIYIRTAGPDKYDQLSTHDIPWTDQSVKDALTEMAKIYGESDNIAGGTSGALQTDFPTSVGNVLSDKPKAAMVIEGDFVPSAVDTTLKPGEGYNVFAFPDINGSAKSVVIAGNIFVMFKDTPAARAWMQFSASADAAKAWAEQGGFSSPNKNLDPSVYPDPILRETASALGSADVVRFDMSDLQPAAFGATTGQGEWKIFQDFLKNPSDIDGTANALEQAAAKAYGS
jgi:alpha-glucoside transport system substrate-binding protein